MDWAIHTATYSEPSCAVPGYVSSVNGVLALVMEELISSICSTSASISVIHLRIFACRPDISSCFLSNWSCESLSVAIWSLLRGDYTSHLEFHWVSGVTSKSSWDEIVSSVQPSSESKLTALKILWGYNSIGGVPVTVPKIYLLRRNYANYTVQPINGRG